MSSPFLNVSIIGSGKVATWLATEGFHRSCTINHVYSRNIEHAKECAQWCMATPIDSLEELSPDSDLYIFAVKDDCLEELVAQVPFKMGLAVHTAGSISQNIFQGYAHHYGVLYPCQSISEPLSFRKLNVPLCIEGDTPKTTKLLMEMATHWSDDLYAVSEEQRFKLHLAAVFASNFSNALYGIAYDQLASAGLDWQLLMPLIETTTKKVREMTPRQAQTGPACRGDIRVMEQHLNTLTDPALKKIYQLLSEEIQKQQKK